ncbi:hypothetical protein DRN74_00185 [Candidatus Micrarchaeota archaeon]|nr:MAG: hypothetical protein DRN74_00185 [Candidatus Micrarchaeota archaeon]
MGGLWSDIGIAITIILFVYLVKWASDLTKSKTLGIIIGAAIAYFTFYQHFEVLLFVLLFFFGYPFWESLTKGFLGE